MASKVISTIIDKPIDRFGQLELLEDFGNSPTDDWCQYLLPSQSMIAKVFWLSGSVQNNWISEEKNCSSTTT